MNIETLTPVISDTLLAATPLVLAALGELVTEKAGGNLYLGLLVAMLLGVAIALIHALLTISLAANQDEQGRVWCCRVVVNHQNLLMLWVYLEVGFATLQ